MSEVTWFCPTYHNFTTKWGRHTWFWFLSIGEKLRLRLAYAFVQIRQSHRFFKTQSMDIEKAFDQKFDLYQRWICLNVRLKEAFAHMRFVPKSHKSPNKSILDDPGVTLSVPTAFMNAVGTEWVTPWLSRIWMQWVRNAVGTEWVTPGLSIWMQWVTHGLSGMAKFRFILFWNAADRDQLASDEAISSVSKLIFFLFKNTCLHLEYCRLSPELIVPTRWRTAGIPWCTGICCVKINCGLTLKRYLGNA